MNSDTLVQHCREHLAQFGFSFSKTRKLGRQSLCGLLVLVMTALGCDRTEVAGGDDHRADSHAEDSERGAHRGRLLRDGDFALEVTIFEAGVPPQFRVYGFASGRPIAPAELSANVELTRLGGRIDRFELSPTGDFLSSSQEVQEPHSFDVKVSARYQGRSYAWSYNSPEARTEIPRQVADASDITVERVGSRQIRVSRRMRGKILPSEHRIAHVIPRFSGLVREGRKHIGDAVEKGEVLAVIESNQSLQPFEVRSQIAGTVINGHLIVGEFVPENQWVYIVADLSEVWADFFVPISERGSVRIGQGVVVDPISSGVSITGVVSYVAPYADERSQSQLVRAVIPNPNGELLPGMFVSGDLITDEVTAPTVIKQAAVQHLRDWEVVFVRYGDTYEARPITLGRVDGEWVEVVEGLEGGEEYVSGNSFLIKADILKSGASHDH